MDNRETLSKIVQENIIDPSGRAFYYPNIPDKVIKNLTSYFDPHIQADSISVFFDTSIFRTCGYGLVLTLTGLYYSDTFVKPYYINYRDIQCVTVIPDSSGKTNTKEAKISIHLSNGTYFPIGYGDFFKDNLKNVLNMICQKFNKANDVVIIKPSGEVGSIQLSKDQTIKCNTIIHTAAVAAGGAGAGLAQVPLSDNAIIIPIQVTMITALGSVFEIRVTESIAKGIISGAVASFLGRNAVQILVGWIPGVGNVINTATAAGITEAIGWIAVAHFLETQQTDSARYEKDGMKKGYAAASEEYAKKLKDQADQFLNQEKDFKKEREAYEQLLSEYDECIKMLKLKIDKSEEELNRLKTLEAQYNALKNMQKIVEAGKQHDS
ncbi:MAG: hypothetical protein QM657_07190 [Lacrimispora sp.]|uniref:hypothetical protein n=1 Tax=Lacrimispora sp. TaxID=2719234 RepID=UPI0039E2FD53